MQTKTLGLFLLSLLAPTAAFSQSVDPQIHKLCVEAKDYAGCVRAMRGETAPASRTINSQGADIAEGNSCPAGSAYLGGGSCQRVICSYSRGNRMLGHDSIIAGLKDKDGKDVWGCDYNWMFGGGVLRLDGPVSRLSMNANCPSEEPKIGFNSTCQTASKDFEPPAVKAARKEQESPKCDFKLKAYNCSFNAYLEANPAMKRWAELNPEMAAKEKAKLGATD